MISVTYLLSFLSDSWSSSTQKFSEASAVALVTSENLTVWQKVIIS